MGRVPLILGTFWVIATIGSAYGFADDNSHVELQVTKRQASSGPCAGIVCAQAPGNNCQQVNSGKDGINSCCPDFECRNPDGTVSKHSGIAGSGAKGSSRVFVTPDGKGFAKEHSTSSFSSSSSSSDGPGAMKPFDFNGPTPPALPPAPFMGPPPGFMDPPPGFMGPPPGFFGGHLGF